jgi:putative DNA primase/helicase
MFNNKARVVLTQDTRMLAEEEPSNRQAQPPRPTRPPEPVWENIPDLLTARHHWVMWRYEWKDKDQRHTKVLYMPNGKPASSTDPATWSPYEDVQIAYLNHASRWDGVGFVLDSERFLLVGWDFDHCLDAEGRLDPTVELYVRWLDSYTEKSPSGTGLRVLTIGKLPPKDRRIGNCQVYESGRYLTITGNRLPDSPAEIREAQEAIDEIHGAIFAERRAKHEQASARPAPGSVNLDDVALLEKARASRNGGKFAALYDRGDWKSQGFPSQSEADLCLAGMLAFWAQGDAARVDVLFRSSGMMRAKWWDREDYRQETIAKAIEQSTFYDPSYTRPVIHLVPNRKEQPEPDFSIEGENDIAVASALFHDHGKDLLYCPSLGGSGWLIWDGKRFRQDETSAIVARVTDTVRGFLLQAARERLPERIQWWTRLINSYSKIERMRGALAVLAPRVAVMVDELDRDPHLLNVDNGTVDLRDGSLLQHSREHKITKLIPIPFHKDAAAERWHRFLSEIFNGGAQRRGETEGEFKGRQERAADLAGYIKSRVGYALTAEQKEQDLAILWGPGSNGKGVLANLVQRSAGEYAQTAPTQLFMKQYGDAVPTDVARLRGARVVIASESSEDGRLDEEKIKMLTGTSTGKITARFMRKDFFEFTPSHHLFLQTNHKPKVVGADYAVWRRLKLIPIEVKFEDPSDENPEPLYLKDKALEDTLIATELPGILRWAIEGAVEWYRDGLKEPKVVTRATQQYREEEDVLAAFVKDRCEVGPDFSEAIGKLHEDYLDWAKAEGEKYPWSKNKLSRRLTDAGYVADRDSSRYRKGLRLKGVGSDGAA